MKTIRKMMLACVLASAAAVAQFAAAHAQEKAAPATPTTPVAVTTTTQKLPVPSGPQKIVKQGVEVEFTIEPVTASDKRPATDLQEEQDALVRFRITDTATHTPLAGARPSVWMSQRESDTSTPEVCKEKVGSFLQGSLRSRPDVDLNNYFVLALNSEPSISVIDPLLGFGGSKLTTLIMLKSPGEDWVMTRDQERLFVSMPAINQVAVIDTNTWKVVANVDTAARPVRLALQPDEKYLWVGTDEGADSGVTVIDATTFKQVARLATAAGHHEIALSGDNRTAFVTNTDAGTLSVLDVKTLAKTAEIKTGRGANSVAVSQLSKFVYVSDEVAGKIVVVDGTTAKVVGQIAVAPGVGAVRFAPGGRYGFAPNKSAAVVYVFDVSTNRLLHTIKVGKGPDQIAFTREFAYVRSAASLDVTMIRLVTVGKQVDVIKFPAGQSAPTDSGTPVALADSIFPAPEGNSMLVANSADKVIYYYTEGMAAPMGNFENYKREPRAVLVADRSLREVKTGTYETVTRLPQSGVYDVAFLLDSPRILHCFEAKAVENPTVEHEKTSALRIEYLDKEKPLRAGVGYNLRFRLTDTASGKLADGLKDVRVLTFLSPGIWQKRDFAQAVGGGVYELKIDVPEPGFYMIFVESRSRGVAFRQLPYLTLRATDAEAAKPSAPEGAQQ
ncbi:MAG: hypothetical protein QOJ70_2249 [Acidobacteriota bacterium]|jgi:YVTN family beta-propeller protein|nr:hypothetical protein [Acidobacteriota bacterium]